MEVNRTKHPLENEKSRLLLYRGMFEASVMLTYHPPYRFSSLSVHACVCMHVCACGGGSKLHKRAVVKGRLESFGKHLA